MVRAIEFCAAAIRLLRGALGVRRHSMRQPSAWSQGSSACDRIARSQRGGVGSRLRFARHGSRPGTNARKFFSRPEFFSRNSSRDTVASSSAGHCDARSGSREELSPATGAMRAGSCCAPAHAVSQLHRATVPWRPTRAETIRRAHPGTHHGAATRSGSGTRRSRRTTRKALPCLTEFARLSHLIQSSYGETRRSGGCFHPHRNIRWTTPRSSRFPSGRRCIS